MLFSGDWMYGVGWVGEIYEFINYFKNYGDEMFMGMHRLWGV